VRECRQEAELSLNIKQQVTQDSVHRKWDKPPGRNQVNQVTTKLGKMATLHSFNRFHQIQMEKARANPGELGVENRLRCSTKGNTKGRINQRQLTLLLKAWRETTHRINLEEGPKVQGHSSCSIKVLKKVSVTSDSAPSTWA
jgi:hypothetical protein